MNNDSIDGMNFARQAEEHLIAIAWIESVSFIIFIFQKIMNKLPALHAQ